MAGKASVLWLVVASVLAGSSRGLEGKKENLAGSGGLEGIVESFLEDTLFHELGDGAVVQETDGCGGKMNQKECDDADGCTWCMSAAVPSKCYRKQDASNLPPGVFVCDTNAESSFELDITMETSVSGKLRGERKLCDPDVAQISGYFRLGDQNKGYFFWFFESRNKPESDPVTVWLSGGPGCSSMLALFAENGPCSVNEYGNDTIYNKFSWNSNSNLMFIDQPPGTGFSYGSLDHDEEGVSKDMDMFLTEFMKKYTKYANLPFYIFGESYAGHYVPAIAHRVWKNNQNRTLGVPKINLKGASVGNGLTDPEVQYRYFAQMAYNSTTAPRRVSTGTYYAMKAATPVCIAAIKSCNLIGSDTVCGAAVSMCNSALIAPYQMTGYNVYNMEEKCKVPPLCYDFNPVTKYLRRPDVMEILGVDTDKQWSSCDPSVHLAMLPDWMHNYQDQIPALLENGIRVLIYAGDLDFICNWLGNQAWTLALEWKDAQGFNSAEPKEWKVNEKPAGMLRSYGGFSFLQFYGAGHMVPMDKKEESLAMFNSFINGEW